MTNDGKRLTVGEVKAAFATLSDAVEDLSGTLRELGAILRDSRLRDALRAAHVHTVAVSKINAAELEVLGLEEELYFAQHDEHAPYRNLPPRG